MDGVAIVAAAYGHTAAIKEDGTLWKWGANNFGQIGNGQVDYVEAEWDSHPLVWKVNADPVMIMEEVVAVSNTGGGHTLALTNDGRLWAWGNNGDGQLGIVTDGTMENRYTPVLIME